MQDIKAESHTSPLQQLVNDLHQAQLPRARRLDSENEYFERYHGTHAAFGGEQKAAMVISSEEFAIEGRPAVHS